MGERVRVVIARVEKASKGPGVVVSRAAPELVQHLFQTEVPEIYDGTVVIRAIAREAGERTKIAVMSKDKEVDAVGACVGMKGMRVQSITRELRGWSKAPILVLSAVGDEGEKVAALDAGADDYVTKPFGIEELLARLRAVMRRAAPSSEPVVELGDVVVDLERRLVTLHGEPVALTPTEFDLLRLFVRNEGKLLTHPTILREVWGPAYGDESHYLHVYVSQLRQKLEADPTRPRMLLTEPGAGYRLLRPS
jgi:two-component system KDP operon response regulator KdpE